MACNGALDLTGVTMPNGASYSAVYSGGFPNSTTSPHGATTNYTYNFNATASIITVTTNGHWVKSTMDGLGRTIKVENGDGSSTKSVTESVYGACACSPMGKVMQVSQPHAPNAGAIWTTYTYDALGRTLTITRPDNSVTRYEYTGNVTKVTDAAGNWKKFTTDSLGNLVQVTEPDPQLGNVNTNYTYNLLNKLTQVQMTRNGTTQTRTFAYDNLGQGARLMSATNPENGTVSYTYNADDTLATRTDAKGQIVQYSYDSYQRLIRVHRSDGSEDNYTYDTYSTSGFTSQYAWGRLAAVTFRGQQVNEDSGTASFTYMYSYTPAGLVTAKRLRTQLEFPGLRTLTPPDLEAGYAYDNEGRMTSLTYPLFGQTFGYGYDSMGRPNTLSQTAGTTGLNRALPISLVASVSYGPAGELLSMSGVIGEETRTYNSLLQLTSVSASGQFDPLVSMQYTYPEGANIGKISKQKNLLNGEELQYQYDTLGRLISAETTAASPGPVWGYSYGFDGFGNLTAKNVTKGSPSAGGVGGGTVDANGNVIYSLQGTMTYDVENRMTSNTFNGTEWYGYDPSNKRVQKTRTDGTTELHFYGAHGERLGIYELLIDVGYTASYSSYKANVYFAGKHLAWYNGAVFNKLGVDRLGSESSSLYPWGEEKTTTGQNKEKFATYYRDGTGLDYAVQRYYSSIMGRFLTPDPYRATSSGNDPASPQSWNR